MGLIPEEDIEFLEEKGYNYELREVGPELLVIIHEFPFATYSPNSADLMIRLLAGYPQTNVDMFYTRPDVKLENGSYPQSCDQHPQFDGAPWQQWSRHIIWRPGVDNLRSFLTAAIAEIKKGI
jgi:hypothetical protein